MKKLILSVILILFLSSPAWAQIVLNPPDAVGYIERSISIMRFTIYRSPCGYSTIYGSLPPYAGTFSFIANPIRVIQKKNLTWTASGPGASVYCPGITLPSNWWWYTYWFTSRYASSVIEFDISSLSGAGVTESNFQSAMLEHLQVASSTGNSMTVRLHDLNDSSEDGVISPADFNNFAEPEIATLFTSNPPVGTTYDIDVTDAVYNDLFGPGSGEIYTGFVLDSPRKPPSANEYDLAVTFDSDLPQLTITITEQVPSMTIYGILLIGVIFSVYAFVKLKDIKTKTVHTGE